MTPDSKSQDSVRSQTLHYEEGELEQNSTFAQDRREFTQAMSPHSCNGGGTLSVFVCEKFSVYDSNLLNVSKLAVILYITADLVGGADVRAVQIQSMTVTLFISTIDLVLYRLSPLFCLIRSSHRAVAHEDGQKYEIHPNWRLLPIHDCGVRTVFNGDIGQMMTKDDIAELGQHPWIAAIFVKTNAVTEVHRKKTKCRAWLLLGWVTAERPCPCKLPACPVIGGGSEVSWSPGCVRADSVVFECGGSLINASFKVTLGEHNQSTYVDCNKEKTHCAPPRVNKEVDDVIIHPDYYITKSQFFSRTDIALVRLKRQFEYFTDYIRPICLPTFATYQDFDGRQMEVAGWGTTSSGEDSDTLQSVRVPVVPYKKCFKLWNEAVLERKLCKSDDEEGCQIDFEDNVICAGGVEGKGVSKGYSGGPLITPMRVPGSGHVMFIIGVVSFGVDKFHNLSVPPDVYTRVSQYMMWIMDTIKD
ncbi:hypothetical protein J6590_034130 [Homalodisca vitripennis]|nr:hypothetical protein J6590_034130 [Homalodisca vitripennis]